MDQALGSSFDGHLLKARERGGHTGPADVVEVVELGMDVCFLLDVSGSMAGAEAREMVAQLNWLLFESGMLGDKDTVQILVLNQLNTGLHRDHHRDQRMQCMHPSQRMLQEKKAFRARREQEKRARAAEHSRSVKPFQQGRSCLPRTAAHRLHAPAQRR